jgi:hypothetical protein
MEDDNPDFEIFMDYIENIETYNPEDNRDGMLESWLDDITDPDSNFILYMINLFTKNIEKNDTSTKALRILRYIKSLL